MGTVYLEKKIHEKLIADPEIEDISSYVAKAVKEKYNSNGGDKTWD